MTTAEQALAAVARLRKIHADALEEIRHSGHCRVKWLEFVGSSQDSHDALLDAVEALLVERALNELVDSDIEGSLTPYYAAKAATEQALAKLAEVAGNGGQVG